MPKIFISHSSKDNDFAAKLANTLREWGAEVWIDLADIPAGMKWSKAIQQGLDWGELMLLIVTSDSMASENVADEWEYYHQKKKPIIPVWRTPAEMPFQLHRLQYVDFHQRDFDVALTKLGAELMRLGFAWPTPPPAISRIQEGEPADSPSQTSAVTNHASSSELQNDTRQYPLIIKPDWIGRVIPEPFEWCVIPAGTVTLKPIGADYDYLKQEQTFVIPEFRIGRYAITNEQFRVFVAAQDGWRNMRWWDYSSEAKAWRKKNSQSEAGRFADCSNCPREMVAWYSSVAFTRWLSFKTGENITLPTEQQWQRAAQGDDGRAYTLGDVWTAGNCNSRESGIGKTTPVTDFPLDASPFGVLGMVGNVSEWCLTDLKTGLSDLIGADLIDGKHSVRLGLLKRPWSYLSGKKGRMVRGASWDHDSADSLRVDYRNWVFPDYGYDFVGFRCVRF